MSGHKRESLMHQKRNWILCITCLLFSVGTLLVQSVDTGVLGTVTNPTGAAVPNATVTLTQASSGMSHTAQAGTDDSCEIRYLIPGEYMMDVVASGFHADHRHSLVIDIGQLARINFSLQIGATQQVISVSGTPPLLQTQSAATGDVVGSAAPGLD
jgi:hypothetical protein